MKARILTVSTSSKMVELYRSIFEPENWFVSYTGPKEVLSVCRSPEEPYDIVMLDHTVPLWQKAALVPSIRRSSKVRIVCFMYPEERLDEEMVRLKVSRSAEAAHSISPARVVGAIRLILEEHPVKPSFGTVRNWWQFWK